MDAKSRRNILLEKLKNSKEPLTGTALARDLAVSRQIIVGDIAILRAAGLDIYATPQGYTMPQPASQNSLTAKLVCLHDKEGMVKELTTIIDNGGKVLDVIVEHSVYGELKATLHLSSRRELSDFLEKLAAGAEPLYSITGGVHLHTIEVPSHGVLECIENDLRAAGILID